MVPDNPVPGTRYGSFTVNGGPKYHLAASVSGKRLYVWLNNIDTGPVVAVFRELDSPRPKLELRDAWMANSSGWKLMFRTTALSLYRTGPISVDEPGVRVCEG